MVKMQDFKRLFAAALGHKEEKSTEAPLSGLDEAAITALIAAFGGHDNIVSFDACLTRLRVKVNALQQVDSEALQGLGAIGVIIICALYFTRRDRKRQCIIGAVLFAFELTAPLAFLFIWFYNGQRGKCGKALQKCFYGFYPVHIALLALITNCLL